MPRQLLVALGLGLLRTASSLQEVDKHVWRPASWGGIFKDGDKKISTVANSVVGHGLAQPHVLPCATPTFEADGKAYECFRLYLVVDPKVCRSTQVIYGNAYSGISLKTADGSDFFQAKAGIGVDVGGVGPALFEYVPTAEFDSWFTIGADDGTASSKLSVVGMPDFTGTSTYESDNGAICEKLSNPPRLQACTCTPLDPSTGVHVCPSLSADSLRPDTQPLFRRRRCRP
eukprot:COSAG05_NODE_204_length_14187_cov_99.887422_12_plen_230_part_00